jgi:integrase
MLTEVQCKKASCPADKKKVKLADAGGLYLMVQVNGSKRWFLKYRKDGVEKHMALGGYPLVTLAAARLARDQAKLQKLSGVDPIENRLTEKRVQTQKTDPRANFATIAWEWFETNKSNWSEHHAFREKRNLEKDLLPHFKERQIADITSLELLKAVKLVEDRNAIDMAHRVLTTARSVWSFAVPHFAERNITFDLTGKLKPHKTKHFAAITDPKKLTTLIQAIWSYQGSVVVRAALKLAPMLFQRPTELRGMEWKEVDLDAAMWKINSKRMKRSVEEKENGSPHFVPLPHQAVEILRSLHPYTGNGELVFPGERSASRSISENTLSVAMLSLGISRDVQSVHGFRATARTILEEVLDVEPLLIEAQLSHKIKDANGRAYNRTQYVVKRTEMMQLWADYLDGLRASVENTGTFSVK